MLAALMVIGYVTRPASDQEACSAAVNYTDSHTFSSGETRLRDEVAEDNFEDERLCSLTRGYLDAHFTRGRGVNRGVLGLSDRAKLQRGPTNSTLRDEFQSRSEKRAIRVLPTSGTCGSGGRHARQFFVDSRNQVSIMPLPLTSIWPRNSSR